MKQKNQNFKIGIHAALQQLTDGRQEFISLFNRGSLQIELDKPSQTDKQQPHTRDELYVIVLGTAHFYNQGTAVQVSANDCLHVPAFAEHHFLHFSEDF